MSFPNADYLTFNHSTLNHVQGNLYNNTYKNQPGERGIRELFKRTCPGAAYDAQCHHPTPLHRQTTQDLVVKEVFDWIDGGRTGIFWLYGAPRTGKSSIAQAIAAQCLERGIKLGASFFAKGSHPHIASTHLIPSVAYQLGISLLEWRTRIGGAVEHDPSILHRPLEDQIHELIIKPFFPAFASHDGDESGTRPPTFVIIDGLDQCFSSYHQLWIPHLLRGIASTKGLPIVWLITSRCTYQIRQSFDAISDHIHAVSLSAVDRAVEAEHSVSTLTFLRHRLNEMYEKYPVVMEVLPPAVFVGLFISIIVFLGSFYTTICVCDG